MAKNTNHSYNEPVNKEGGLLELTCPCGWRFTAFSSAVRRQGAYEVWKQHTIVDSKNKGKDYADEHIMKVSSSQVAASHSYISCTCGNWSRTVHNRENKTKFYQRHLNDIANKTSRGRAPVSNNNIDNWNRPAKKNKQKAHKATAASIWEVATEVLGGTKYESSKTDLKANA